MIMAFFENPIVLAVEKCPNGDGDGGGIGMAAMVLMVVMLPVVTMGVDDGGGCDGGGGDGCGVDGGFGGVIFLIFVYKVNHQKLSTGFGYKDKLSV